MHSIRRRWARALASALVFVATAGCNANPTPSIGVDNGTTLPVTIVTNGTVLDTVPPQTQREVPTAALGSMPWIIQATSPSGRVLLELVVPPGVVWRTTEPDGSTSMHGAASRIDLSCGRLDVYVGPPLAGPMPGSGVPGDCDP